MFSHLITSTLGSPRFVFSCRVVPTPPFGSLPLPFTQLSLMVGPHPHRYIIMVEQPLGRRSRSRKVGANIVSSERLTHECSCVSVSFLGPYEMMPHIITAAVARNQLRFSSCHTYVPLRSLFHRIPIVCLCSDARVQRFDVESAYKLQQCVLEGQVLSQCH